MEKAEVGKGEDDFGVVLKRRQHAADLGDSAGRGGDPESTQKLLDDYFGADDAQLGEEDKFLKRFIANKACDHPSCISMQSPSQSRQGTHNMRGLLYVIAGLA